MDSSRPPPPRCLPGPQLSSVTYSWARRHGIRIFHRDLNVSAVMVWRWLCCAVGGKLSWNRRTHFLAWWPWKISHFSVLWSSVGLFGLRFPLCHSYLRGLTAYYPQRIVSVISKWLMSGAIKFSSRAPGRWFVSVGFTFLFVILNSFDFLIL